MWKNYKFDVKNRLKSVRLQNGDVKGMAMMDLDRGFLRNLKAKGQITFLITRKNIILRMDSEC